MFLITLLAALKWTSIGAIAAYLAWRGIRIAVRYGPWPRRMRRLMQELLLREPETYERIRNQFEVETDQAMAARDGKAFRQIRARALADAEAAVAAIRSQSEA